MNAMLIPMPDLERPRTRSMPIAPSNSRAKRSLIFALAIVASIHLAVLWLVRSGPADVRDPEYGLRLVQLRHRLAEHPNRPLVVVLGSSRTAQGIRPEVCNENGPGPLLFNMSTSGGGPIVQLLVLRRLLNEGIVPAGIVAEFWPPWLRGDGAFHEQWRIDPRRLLPGDEATIREFALTPDWLVDQRHGDSPWPLVGQRRLLQSRFAPFLVAENERTDGLWSEIDGWGWWPGRTAVPQAMIDRGWGDVERAYRPIFDGYRVEPSHANAMRAVLAECRERRIPTTLIRMPESQRFRAMTPPDVERLASEALLDWQREFDVPFADFREASNDLHLPDGFHLTRDGAAEFTRRHAAAIIPLGPLRPTITP